MSINSKERKIFVLKFFLVIIFIGFSYGVGLALVGGVENVTPEGVQQGFERLHSITQKDESQ